MMASGPGRAPAYCQDPEHNRATAYAERRRRALNRVSGGGETAANRPPDAVPALPLTAASWRLSSDVDRLQEAALTLQDLGERILADLSQLSDTDTMNAEVAGVRAEAHVAIAAAQAKIVDAEKATRSLRTELSETKAELTQTTEDHAAAREVVEQQQRDLAEMHTARERAEHAAASAEEARHEAEQRAADGEAAATSAQEQAAAALAQAQAEQRAASDATLARDAAIEQAQHAHIAKATAEQAAVNAVQQLAQVTTEKESLHNDLALALRDKEASAARIATLTAEMASCKTRLAEQREDYEQRLSELRKERDAAIDQARHDQRRADQLEIELKLINAQFASIQRADAEVSTHRVAQPG